MHFGSLLSLTHSRMNWSDTKVSAQRLNADRNFHFLLTKITCFSKHHSRTITLCQLIIHVFLVPMHPKILTMHGVKETMLRSIFTMSQSSLRIPFNSILISYNACTFLLSKNQLGKLHCSWQNTAAIKYFNADYFLA